MRDRESAAVALHRFGLGPRPGDIERIAADPRGAFLAELRSPPVKFPDRLPVTPRALAAIRQRNEERRRARQDRLERSKLAAGTAGMPGSPESERLRPAENEIYRREVAARLHIVRTAEIGFRERLVAFWMNHFTVDAMGVRRGLVGAFEREAIRPHVTGRFADMLLAVTKHPAMLTYLNTVRSAGPNSLAGKARGIGLNENHARELLELHTVGVGAGYTQEDVAALARMLTGWSYARGDLPRLGRFVFRPRLHEPGPKRLMGISYGASGARQGEAALRDLARHPATARRIATALATAFVADVPPPALVERMAAQFTATDGDLAAVASVLIGADEAWVAPSKLKSPQEFIWSSIRALELAPKPALAIQAVNSLGQPFWTPASPKGYPLDGRAWLSPDGFADRLEAAERLIATAQTDRSPPELLDAVLGPRVSKPTRAAVGRAATRDQGFALILMSPEFQRR